MGCLEMVEEGGGGSVRDNSHKCAVEHAPCELRRNNHCHAYSFGCLPLLVDGVVSAALLASVVLRQDKHTLLLILRHVTIESLLSVHSDHTQST